MLIESIDYTEYRGTDQQWVLDGLVLGDRNLVVGKNATGKSRTLNLISGLAKLLLGERLQSLRTGDYRVKFLHGGSPLIYSINVEDRQVITESVVIDQREVLRRGVGGEGTILAERIDKGRMIEFQTPQDEVAAFVRRDAKQHSFLEPLHTWANSLRHYYFGTSMGKEKFAVQVKRAVSVPEGKSSGDVVALFGRAKKDFPGLFVDKVKRDMASVDYPISDIGVGPPISIRFDSPLSDEPVALWVQEEGLKGRTDQPAMSQGMFRVLSLLILTNYMECRQIPACLIIDDIGEGLDFERSCLLIDILRQKTKDCGIQLITSTNDRFVMNRVPLEEWSVLQRQGSHVRVLNYGNSRELFEDFRFTGLSNFSFLELDYPNAQPQETAAHE